MLVLGFVAFFHWFLMAYINKETNEKRQDKQGGMKMVLYPIPNQLCSVEILGGERCEARYWVQLGQFVL